LIFDELKEAGQNSWKVEVKSYGAVEALVWDLA
jgi:hypothetical protein